MAESTQKPTKRTGSGTSRTRARPTKRVVAPAGFQPDFTSRNLTMIAQENLHEITTTLSVIRDSEWLTAAIQNVSISYRRSLQQPQPSKPEAKAQLANLAHTCLAVDPNNGVAVTDTRRAISELNPLALTFLWAALSDLLGVPPDVADRDLRAGDVDWANLAEAAAPAGKRAPGAGDYPDRNLAAAIQDLVYTYEKSTGLPATWSATDTGPISKGGTQRQIAGSECGRFIHAFFDVQPPCGVCETCINGKLTCPPPVADTQISNALRKYLDKRRAMAANPDGQSFAAKAVH